MISCCTLTSPASRRGRYHVSFSTAVCRKKPSTRITRFWRKSSANSRITTESPSRYTSHIEITWFSHTCVQTHIHVHTNALSCQEKDALTHYSQQSFPTISLLFQYAFWDRFKSLEDMSVVHVSHLMRLVAHLVVKAALSLALLKVCCCHFFFLLSFTFFLVYVCVRKAHLSRVSHSCTLRSLCLQVVDFTTLSSQAVFAFQILFAHVLTHYKQGLATLSPLWKPHTCSHMFFTHSHTHTHTRTHAEVVDAVFERLAHNEEQATLSTSVCVFLKHSVVSFDKGLGDGGTGVAACDRPELLRQRVKRVRRILMTPAP